MAWLWDPAANADCRAVRNDKDLLEAARIFTDEALEMAFFTTKPSRASYGTPFLDLQGREEPAILKKFYRYYKHVLLGGVPTTNEEDYVSQDEYRREEGEPFVELLSGCAAKPAPLEQATCWVFYTNSIPRAIMCAHKSLCFIVSISDADADTKAFCLPFFDEKAARALQGQRIWAGGDRWYDPTKTPEKTCELHLPSLSPSMFSVQNT